MATEKRLIDSKGKFALNDGCLTGHVMCFENGYATVFDRFAKVICKFSLLDAPTVDAVEVVRCKDCKHFVAPQGVSGCDCFYGLGFAEPDDFCSYGERKNNG